MRRYRRVNRFFAATAAAYLVIAVAGRAVRSDEFFPFASWSLFSKVPNEVRDYTVRIVAVNGQTLDRPVDFENSRELFGPAAASHGARMIIQRIGEAANRADASATTRARASFESLHLREHRPVRYELVERRYDPIERWRDGKFRSTRTMGTFQVEGLPAETRP